MSDSNEEFRRQVNAFLSGKVKLKAVGVVRNLEQEVEETKREVEDADDKLSKPSGT